MKKASRFWIWLFLFSLFPVTTSAQVQSYVSKQKALSIAQAQFRGQDVDYYLIDENKSPTWQVFVDAEPMKGWKHDCYVIRIPKSLDISQNTPFPQQLLTTPPQGEYTPLLVTNRYGNNANSKPRVKKAVPSLNEGASTASRTYAVILSGGVDKFSNYERYWNDCSFIYQTLVNKYGVPKQNIYPIMSDGDNPAVDMHCTSGSFVSQPLDLDFDGVADIHLAATKDNVRNTLSTLSKKLNKDDHLFFFVIDHGASENLGEKSSVVVNPKATGYDYSVVAMTEEGDMCTGSITLEKDGGIKSVGNPTPERLIVALETPAPAMATLSVTSVLDGTCVISCPVAAGAENVSLDTSRLSRGVYVVSYSVNSELIDQKKVRLD